MTTLKLRQSQVEEIISLLRGFNNKEARYRWADKLEERLVESGSTYVCTNCGNSFPQSRGRPRKTCSDGCRQAIWRKKNGRQAQTRRDPPWTPEQVDKLIEVVGAYYGTQHWAYGQRNLAWAAVASEVGRTSPACQTKYRQLIRQGIVKEWER